MTMKTEGSKSAPTKKSPKTPAEGGPPEVTLHTGTTAVLPNPADAPPPAKTKMRRSSKEPKTAAAGVPAWAKRAAARDTAKEMAAGPEAAPKPEPATDAPVAAPTAKKGRAPKTPKAAPAKEAPAAAPGLLRAIGNAWIDSLRAAGHTPSTTSSYTNDFELANEFFGERKMAADVTEKEIAKFNECQAVLRKKNGKAKAKPTILKTRRALRLALVWAEQKGLIKKAPFAAKTSA